MAGALDSIGTHLSQSLKFLVCKRGRSEIMCVGGPWSHEIDGGDPSTPDDTGLQRAAMCVMYFIAILMECASRWAKEQIDIDLSQCERWIRFMEVHYARLPERPGLPLSPEITVIFLLDALSIAGIVRRCVLSVECSLSY
jgi:hypothetical protein